VPAHPVGWVTVHKGGKELVTPRGSLHAGRRQQYLVMWARRLAVDRRYGNSEAKARSSSRDRHDYAAPTKVVRKMPVAADPNKNNVYKNELHSDPLKIGFAFGGVEPGRLHARGQLVETHKVHYSIAMCGTYWLHVALRHENVELPGSPFLLQVTAGPASALSTALPADVLPLKGLVGGDRTSGCHVLLKSLDKMGNQCESGGANVKCSCTGASETLVESRVVDHKNGSYSLEWRSRVSGTFDAHILIDGHPIIGSPTPLTFGSGLPDLAKSELTGNGLAGCTAGKSTSFFIKCRDTFGNPAHPGSSMVFEMALLPLVEGMEKKTREERASLADRWKVAPAHAFTGTWREEEYEIHYVAEVAGNLELHVWCVENAYQDTPSGAHAQNAGAGGEGSGERQGTRKALPASPFIIHCQAGRAHAQGSSVEGFTRIDMNAEQQGAQGGRRGAAAGLKAAPISIKRSKARESLGSYEDSNEVYAGDALSVRPKIRDKLGNNTAAPEGAMIVSLSQPQSEETVELKPTMHIRSGLTYYDVRCEPQLVGLYELNVLLWGAPIAGCPVIFECISNQPDVGKSTYVLPTDIPQLFSHRRYAITVYAKDRCGNPLDHGGAAVTGRLQSANLPPQQDTILEVEDKEDGTYELYIQLKAAAELKVIIAIDKDRQGDGGGEFAPIPMSFISEEALKARVAKEAAKASLQQAGAAIIAENGSEKSFKQQYVEAEELVEIAADEFAAKGKERAARRGGGAGTAFLSAIGSAASVDGTPVGTPDKLQLSSSRGGGSPAMPRGGRSPSGPLTPGSGGRLRKAAAEMMEGFGKADERRHKETTAAGIACIAVETMADVGKRLGKEQANGSAGEASSSGTSSRSKQQGSSPQGAAGGSGRPAYASFGSATSSYGTARTSASEERSELSSGGGSPKAKHSGTSSTTGTPANKSGHLR